MCRQQSHATGKEYTAKDRFPSENNNEVLEIAASIKSHLWAIFHRDSNHLTENVKGSFGAEHLLNKFFLPSWPYKNRIQLS
jgi:hypothetical protein